MRTTQRIALADAEEDTRLDRDQERKGKKEGIKYK
jgi:hypothetical protein